MVDELDPETAELTATTAWLDRIRDDPQPEPTPFTGHVEQHPLVNVQLERTLAFLLERVGQATYRRRETSRWEPEWWPAGEGRPPAGPLARVEDPHSLRERSAAILIAEPWDPEFHRELGLVGRFGELGRVRVTCRACKRKWTAQIEDDYFGGTNRSNGLCMSCALADCRPDLAVAALEGTIVEAATGELPAVKDAPAVEGGGE